MKLTLGFSPCPNDTFIFDALVNGKIDTRGLDFDVVLDDVEALNKMAMEGVLDITKLSYHAFGHVIDNYTLLDSGSALGENCGPLLISKKPIDLTDLKNYKVAIPGKMTTANFLLSLAFPEITHKVDMLFSDIEAAINSGEVDAGLIIHENRFTYQERGFLKIKDLGEYWEELMHLPIPLGGIAIKKELSKKVKSLVNSLIQESVKFAFANPNESNTYVRAHAQEMDIEVMKSHIKLYVNDYSIDLGTKGKDAIQEMYALAVDKKIIPPFSKNIFLEK